MVHVHLNFKLLLIFISSLMLLFVFPFLLYVLFPFFIFCLSLFPSHFCPFSMHLQASATVGTRNSNPHVHVAQGRGGQVSPYPIVSDLMRVYSSPMWEWLGYT